jgi:hypothetical protein
VPSIVYFNNATAENKLWRAIGRREALNLGALPLSMGEVKLSFV